MVGLRRTAEAEIAGFGAATGVWIDPERRLNVTEFAEKPTDGVSHSIAVTGTSLFEVAAAALAQLRDEGWSSLPPDAILRVEVQLPPIVHGVPLKASQRWAREPSVSPKQKLLQEAVGDRSFRRPGR